MAQLPTAQAWLAKWGTNLNAAATNGYIKNGVNAVQQAPGLAAAANASAYAAGVQAAVSNGKWQKAVSAVSLQSWQASMINKGLPRIPQGVTQAQANKVPQITALMGAIQTSVQSISNLPKGGLQQGIARATAFMTAMSQNAPSKTGGQ